MLRKKNSFHSADRFGKLNNGNGYGEEETNKKRKRNFFEMQRFDEISDTKGFLSKYQWISIASLRRRWNAQKKPHENVLHWYFAIYRMWCNVFAARRWQRKRVMSKCIERFVIYYHFHTSNSHWVRHKFQYTARHIETKDRSHCLIFPTQFNLKKCGYRSELKWYRLFTLYRIVRMQCALNKCIQ